MSAVPALAVLGGAGALHLAPALTAIAPVRRLGRFDAWSGLGRADHVALTFDDGPDAASTPRFIEALERLDVRATFFVLGSMVERHPGVARDLVRAGHEIGIHGWAHRPTVLRRPGVVLDDVARACAIVEETCGVVPRFYRPPYGVLSWAALEAARRCELVPVLWTTWGRDWRRAATPASVEHDVLVHLGPGGTVLLHDSDCTSAPRSWENTLAALPAIVAAVRAAGLVPGPLVEHGLVTSRRARHPST